MTNFRQQGAAILLGAGYSTRFGQDKRMLDLQSTPMISYTSLLYQRVFQNTILVLRDTDESLSEIVPPEIEIVYTDRAREGISASIKAGLRTRLESPWVVFGLIDMPFIKTVTLHLLRDQLMKSGRDIVQLQYRKRCGNPVGIPKQYFNDLLTITGDHGAHQLFSRWKENIHVLDVKDAGIHKDIDTQAEWLAYSNRLDHLDTDSS